MSLLKNGISVIVFCLLINLSQTIMGHQVSSEDANQLAHLKVISPEKLKEDLDVLFKTIEEVHPNMYAYTSMKEFEPLREQLYTAITSKMSSLEFYMKVAPSIVSTSAPMGSVLGP